MQALTVDFREFIHAHEVRQDHVGDAARAIATLLNDGDSPAALEDQLKLEACEWGGHRGVQQLAELWMKARRAP